MVLGSTPSSRIIFAPVRKRFVLHRTQDVWVQSRKSMRVNEYQWTANRTQYLGTNPWNGEPWGFLAQKFSAAFMSNSR